MFKALDAPPKSTIQTPGGTGGVNWGGMSMDPVNGVFYVNAQNTTLVGWTQPRPLAVTNPQTGQPRRVDFAGESAGSDHPYDRGSVPANPNATALGPFFTFSAPLNGKNGPGAPCVRPPWAKLYAVNANSGQIVWEVPLGLNENLPAGKQLAGSGGSAGPTATAGGLVFVGATSDGRFRAFDAKTGKELWVTRNPVGANGNPSNAQANPMSLYGQERETVRRRSCRRDGCNLLPAVGRPQESGRRAQGWSRMKARVRRVEADLQVGLSAGA